MELDHTDYFPDETALALSFRRAIERSAVAIVNSDDAKLIKACEGIKTRIITVGTSINADYRYEVISSEPRKMRFKMFLGEKELGEIKLSMLGEFNISNAAAATVAALENGVNFSDAAAALESFYGIERRLEKIGSYEQRDVYYDYAHHPTEIRESVRALRSIGNEKITVIFRPHTYSRTAALWDEFKKAFSYADYLILNPIDAIREKPLADVDSERLANECGAFYACDASQTVELINRTEGIILLMGAADVEEIKKMLTNSGV
jgi:UDP-N-acetylmuramate--alanine ligase